MSRSVDQHPFSFSLELPLSHLDPFPTSYTSHFGPLDFILAPVCSVPATACLVLALTIPLPCVFPPFCLPLVQPRSLSRMSHFHWHVIVQSRLVYKALPALTWSPSRPPGHWD